MSCFNDVCLLKAPQAFDIPFPQDISDLTEMCYLAAVIEDKVNSVSIPVDYYSADPYAEFDRYLKNNRIDLVAISAMTGAFNNAMKFAEIAKKHKKYVVMGGYHPSALYEDVLRYEEVDAVIVGEGEETFEDLVINGSSKGVKGLAFKEDGKTVFTGIRPLIKDIDVIPHPLRRVRPVRFGESGADYTIDTIYTSRGCPWKCTFCSNDLVNKMWRGRSPENVIEEIAQIHNPKIKKILKFWDANFLTSVKRVEKLCDLMLENKLTNFSIWTETRIEDIIRAEGIMDKLYKVGFRTISLGIESPNEETLKLMNKKQTIGKCTKALDVLKKHGIKAQGYFIIGHYTETIEDTKRYPEFATAAGLRSAVFMVMTPYPGTQIYEEYKKEGRIKSLDWNLYNNFGVVVETKSMDSKTLREMHAYCWSQFYTRYAFFNNRSLLGMTFVIVSHVLIFYTILKTDKRNSREDIKDYLLTFLESGCQRLTKLKPRRSPLILKIFKEITIRFRCYPGKNVDFHVTQNENSIQLHVEKTETIGMGNGFTIDLDEIIKFANTISPERAAAASCNFNVMKNNRRGGLQKLYFYYSNKDLLDVAFTVSKYTLSVLTKGTVALVATNLKSVLSKKKLPQSY